MLHQIAKTFSEQQDVIDQFFKNKTKGLIPPLFISCDIRNSGKKLGVIDTNLFPAGFNNLCNAFSQRAAVAFKGYFSKYYPSAGKVLLLSEEHTRNRYYLENIYRLQTLLTSIGLSVKTVYLGTDIQDKKIEVPLSNDRTLFMEKLCLETARAADLIVSNNDFSLELPNDLAEIQKKIIPSPSLGWHRRRKTQHFDILAELINEFAELLKMDPWLLSCIYHQKVTLELSNETERRSLYDETCKIFTQIQAKYQQYNISDPPYVFIKNNAGTYGMGLLEISDPEEILSLNRRKRNKLLSSKGGIPGNDFIIQEGIPTADFYSGLPIEPVIYMIGFEAIGGFFRMNAERDATSSLNAKGMMFSCLCLHKLDEPHEDHFLNCAEKENLVTLSTVMAKIAAIAAALEHQKISA